MHLPARSTTAAPLPAKATIYLRVGDDYRNGQALTLYLWDRDHSVLKRLDRGLKVDDGYVSFKLSPLLGVRPESGGQPVLPDDGERKRAAAV